MQLDLYAKNVCYFLTSEGKARTRKTSTIRRATIRTASRTTTRATNRKTTHPAIPESSEEEDAAGNQAVSEGLKGAVLNCYEYMCAPKGQKHGAILETSTALKLRRNTVGKIVKRGKVQKVSDNKIARCFGGLKKKLTDFGKI